MGVKITGLNEAFDDLEKSIVAEENQMLDNIMVDAIANTPVRTGTLAKSYVVTHAQTLQDTPALENTAPYAIYVELGTNKQEPKLMMTNAVDKEMNKK